MESYMLQEMPETLRIKAQMLDQLISNSRMLYNL